MPKKTTPPATNSTLEITEPPSPDPCTLHSDLIEALAADVGTQAANCTVQLIKNWLAERHLTFAPIGDGVFTAAGVLPEDVAEQLLYKFNDEQYIFETLLDLRLIPAKPAAPSKGAVY